MKKSILLMFTMVLGLVSCKKENGAKPDPPKAVIKAQGKSNSGVYDYQKAILAKRTIAVPSSSQ